MGGYLRTFVATGVREIDAIIQAISDAGDYYHHTEMWNDSEGEPGGKSCVDRIQDAIDKAAKYVNKLEEDRVAVLAIVNGGSA